ncbi:MAG TPA: hypothetical protein PKA50_16210 [Gemmatimonadales bacterium]|nr:hypothetical protein [Gemmatimonadales bacterium]
MIDFITASGSHYRVNPETREVECLSPAASAFGPRTARADSFRLPEVGARFFAVWEAPDEQGRLYLRTSEITFTGRAMEPALAL